MSLWVFNYLEEKKHDHPILYKEMRERGRKREREREGEKRKTSATS